MNNTAAQDTTTPSPSFPEAIAQTKEILSQLDSQQLSEAQLTKQVSALVQSKHGARGFFVAYLTDEHSYADHPAPEILSALKTAPGIISELLVKNLVMSTAMAMTHRRNQDETQAQGSDRVQRRSLELIQRLHLPEMEEQLQHFQASVTLQSGPFSDFLQRWGYDAEQQQAMLQAVTTALSSFV